MFGEVDGLVMYRLRHQYPLVMDFSFKKSLNGIYMNLKVRRQADFIRREKVRCRFYGFWIAASLAIEW